MNGKVKLKRIIYGKRHAGYSTIDAPPKEYIGRIGVIERELIRSEVPMYWVEFKDGKRFVIAKEELEQIS